MRSPGHYHLQNRAYFLASNFRHCMIIVSINYSLSLSLSLGATTQSTGCTYKMRTYPRRSIHRHMDICHLHRGSRLPHATYTSPHFPLASSKPLLHSPPTPPTPPHLTSNTNIHQTRRRPPPPKMTNPRLPKPLTHSPSTPPTPPPAKQIHISHKTPSPSTTPCISITTRTSNAAERPVPVSSPSATNTQVTLNTTIATPTATALPTQTQHTDS